MKLPARLGLGAALVLLGTAPAAAIASSPMHHAPEVKSVRAYDRADGTLLVIVDAAHVTRSAKASKSDAGRVRLVLSRGGSAVTATEVKVLRGSQSTGAPVQFRALLTPKQSAALRLRAAHVPRRLRIGVTAEHRAGGVVLASARHSMFVPVWRVTRGKAGAARAAAAGNVHVTTATGFPPYPLRFGNLASGKPPTVSIDWTWTSPYEPYFSSIIYDQAGECLLQPVYPSTDGRPASGWIQTDGTFSMTSGPGRCGGEYSLFTGTLSTPMDSTGRVPSSATMSLNMAYNLSPFGSPTQSSAVLPVFPE